MLKQKSFFTIIFLLVLVFSMQAQLIHDPYSSLYKDIDVWELRGYIKSTLPMIRPYPLQLIDELLEQVVDNGNEEASAKALRYRDALLIGNDPRNSGSAVYADKQGIGVLHAGVTGSLEGLDDDVSILAAPFVDGTLRLKDWLSGSFSMKIYASDRSPETGYHVPGTYSPYPDMFLDNADMGDLNLTQHWTSGLAMGNSNLYFQSGLMRTSIGPLYDNGVIVGHQAPRAGHFSLVYRQPKWSFESLWLELTASDTTGAGRYSGKHMVTRIYNFRPVPSFEFAFFESIMWGPRIEPLYILPFTMLFASQSMGGFGDNAFMGLLVRWRFAPNLQFLSQIFIDDWHLNDMFRFKFNTKYKLAAEFGLAWAPPNKGPLKSLNLDYTAVFPYMYTHMYDLNSDAYKDRYPSQVGYTGPHPNYQNYSHLGYNLGPDLRPNSDRISIRSSWKVLPALDLGVSAYFTRHGNASQNRIKDGLMDGTYHDGSIHDDGNTDVEPYDNNYRRLNFLTQPLLETKLAGGVSLNWVLPIPFRFGEFSLFADYVAESAWNRNLIEGNDGIVHFWSIGGTFRY